MNTSREITEGMSAVGLTDAERQEHFDKFGYWPINAITVKPSKKQQAARAARLQMLLERRQQRGWRAPLHWRIPALFGHPGIVYEELCHELGNAEGHAEFCRLIKEYWSAIMQKRVLDAQRMHAKWVVRQVLRTFKAQVLGFHGQTVSGRKNTGQGTGLFAKSSGVLQMPEDLIKDGQLIADLPDHLRAYGVPADQIAGMITIIRAKLTQAWGVPA